MKRDINIDLIRIMSCIGVVGLHSFQENLDSINLLFYKFCGFAIPMFFVVSGYFLAIKEATGMRNLKKMLGILITAFLWNLLLWIILSIKNVIDMGSIDFIFLIKSFIMGFLQQGRFWHFWYLAALLIIYALLPLISRFLQPNLKSRIISLWIVALVIGVVLQGFSEFIFGDSLQRHILQPFRLWTWLQYFLLGGILHLYYDNWHGNNKYVIIGLITSSLVMQLYQFMMSKQIHVQYGEAFYDSLFTVIWIIFIFVFFMNLKLGNKMTRFVKAVAPCTIGIYIIHPILIRYVKRMIYPDTFLKSTIVFLVLILSSFTITYVMRRIPVLKRFVNI